MESTLCLFRMQIVTMLFRGRRRLKTGVLPFTAAMIFFAFLESYYFIKFTFVPSFGDASGYLATLKSSQNIKETVSTTQRFGFFTALEPAEETRPQKHKTSLITTTICEREYFLLILVASAPRNQERRRDIRVTWGVDLYATKPRWKTLFLVAQAATQLNSKLANEGALFGDLVRGNYYDHYWNQTLKVQMAFEWASKYCKFSFLLKVDDDVFVNTKALISHLSKPNTPKEKLYMGQNARNERALRNGKWKVTVEEFKGSHYPDFCRGFGYVITADVATLFVDLIGVVPNFRLDDVYVGMLAHKAGLNIIDVEAFEVHGPWFLTTCTLRKNIIVWHGVYGRCLLKIYDQLLKEGKEQALNIESI